MDERDSRCPYLPSGEQAARGTDLGGRTVVTAGKEDPVELGISYGL